MLFLLSGVAVGTIAFWPSISQHDVAMGCVVCDEFTLGYWADFSWRTRDLGWFIAIDQNGPGGHPWTNIAPGIGFPTGWHDPEVVWGATQSLGFGVYFGPGASPVEEATWGEIKSLFE